MAFDNGVTHHCAVGNGTLTDRTTAPAGLDENTIVSFTISFEPNQNQFSADRYGAE